jgi:hypothetical protein
MAHDPDSWAAWTIPSGSYEKEAVRKVMAEQPGQRDANAPDAGQEPLPELYNGGNTWAC